MERLDHHTDAARQMVGEKAYRIWRAYMPGSALAFEHDWISLYHVPAGKPRDGGALPHPLIREHTYTNLAPSGMNPATRCHKPCTQLLRKTIMTSKTKTSPQDHLFVSHPWHGIEPEMDASGILTAFIELVPGENLKFELDKPSGWLRIDRPQKFASRPPVMYGLIPKTYCGKRVGARCMEVTGLTGIKGDGDPMDVLLLAEHTPAYGGLLARARVIGGLRMIDGGEADDKIVAVLEADAVYGATQHIADVPKPIVDRLLHYFTSYKQPPGETKSKVSIPQVYDRDEAMKMVTLSEEDYADHFQLGSAQR